MRRIFSFPTVILLALPTVSLLLVLVEWEDWGGFLLSCLGMFLGIALRVFVNWRRSKTMENT
jgi:hypothetical protein